MTDCLFCKIAADEIPASKVYEDDELIAFLDIKPVNKGHTLIIPKKHFPRLSETDPAVAAELMRAVPGLAKAVMKAVGASSFNLAVNDGALAGQVVGHVHLHIMPRFEGDGYELWHGKPASPDELNEVANSIRQQL